MELKNFDAADFENYPSVETLGGELVPMIARVNMKAGLPADEDLSATVVVDGNGVLVMIYNKEGKQQQVFCKELFPFAFAVFVAEHLEAPLDPEVLLRFAFEQFK